MTAKESDLIKVQFWGVRGSIPSPPTSEEIEEKIVNILLDSLSANLTDEKSIKRFIQKKPFHRRGIIGGNTSCVYVKVAGKHIIFDSGSGIRRLGNLLMKKEFGDGNGVAHIFLSHTHWDHIMGFPFFVPAYVSGNTIIVYGTHHAMEKRISDQQEDEYFPVPLSAMESNIDFVQLRKGETVAIDGINITNKMLNHPGGSFGYRLDYKGKSIVYATDSEYKDMNYNVLEQYINFFQNADILIFDSQFTLIESIEKENWGHSNSTVGIDIAKAAKVKHLILFHHDPSYSNNKLIQILDNATDYLRLDSEKSDLKISIASEGLEISL